MERYRISIIFILLTNVFILNAVRAEDSFVIPHVNSEMSLAILDSPNESKSNVVAIVDGLEKLRVIDESLHWYRVSYDDDEGFVHKRFVEKKENHDELVVHIFDGDNGNLQLIHCPNGENVVFNAGSNFKRVDDELRNYLLSKLDHQSRTIHYSIISSPDLVNYSLLGFLNETFNIDNVFYVGSRSDFSRPFWSWLQKTKSERLTKSVELPIDCGGVALKAIVLNSEDKSYFHTNTSISVALSVEFKEMSFLLIGQTSREIEAKLVKDFSSFTHDFIVASMFRGSTTELTTPFLNKIKPKVVILNGNSNYEPNYPLLDVIDRIASDIDDVSELQKNGWSAAIANRYSERWVELVSTKPIYTTSKSGNIQVIIDGESEVIFSSEYFDFLKNSAEETYAHRK